MTSEDRRRKIHRSPPWTRHIAGSVPENGGTWWASDSGLPCWSRHIDGMAKTTIPSNPSASAGGPTAQAGIGCAAGARVRKGAPHLRRVSRRNHQSSRLRINRALVSHGAFRRIRSETGRGLQEQRQSVETAKRPICRFRPSRRAICGPPARRVRSSPPHGSPRQVCRSGECAPAPSRGIWCRAYFRMSRRRGPAMAAVVSVGSCGGIFFEIGMAIRFSNFRPPRLTHRSLRAGLN